MPLSCICAQAGSRVGSLPSRWGLSLWVQVPQDMEAHSRQFAGLHGEQQSGVTPQGAQSAAAPSRCPGEARDKPSHGAPAEGGHRKTTGSRTLGKNIFDEGPGIRSIWLNYWPRAGTKGQAATEENGRAHARRGPQSIPPLIGQRTSKTMDLEQESKLRELIKWQNLCGLERTPRGA